MLSSKLQRLKRVCVILCLMFEVLFISATALYPLTASAVNDDDVPGIEDFKKGVEPEEQNNEVANVICQVIIFLQGRIGRAIALAALVVMGIQFFLGKVTWTSIVVTGVGFALLFGSKSIALVILKKYVETRDSSGNIVKISTGEAVSKVCPEI
jgi:type IV secretory pathway VirB2 component (pilin)